MKKQIVGYVALALAVALMLMAGLSATADASPIDPPRELVVYEARVVQQGDGLFALEVYWPQLGGWAAADALDGYEFIDTITRGDGRLFILYADTIREDSE